MKRAASCSSRVRSLLLAGLLTVAAGASAQRGPPQPGGGGVQANWSGWIQLDSAYAWQEPSHLANMRTRGEIAGRGAWDNGAKWKLSARAAFDGAYDASDHFPPGVRRDQRSELTLHEAYVDFSRGAWEFRLGKQNIVWGEMVGLFFADVVSAKDLREFILPEFDQIRIPQWAARAEWFGEDRHLEFVWLPAPAVDRIGRPGAEYYPSPLRYDGFGYAIDEERRPSRKLSNSSVGARASMLVSGWDFAAFVYRGTDSQETFYRSLVADPTPTVFYEPRFDRITRAGATVAKDFDGVVAKAEIVLTHGRRFSLGVLDSGNGLVPLRTLDWAVGVGLTPADGWRVNAQLFQRAFLDHDERIGLKRYESGSSLLSTLTLGAGLDFELLGITSLNRRDWLLRAMLVLKSGAQARLRFGSDLFGGVSHGQFGRYDNRDRIWIDYRYSF